MFSRVWLMVLQLLVLTATASEFSPEEIARLNEKIRPASSILGTWLKDIFNSTAQSSLLNECDYSYQSWALNAVRFKNVTENLRHLDVPEPCTEPRDGGLEDLDFSAEPSSYNFAEYLRQNNYSKLPFRVFQRYGTHSCNLHAGAFIRNESALYSVSAEFGRPLNLVHAVNRTEYNYALKTIYGTRGSGPKYSLFMSIPDIDKVPGYKSALAGADGYLSVQESVMQDGVSPSNTAILVLPVLLSFVPVSLLSDEISRSRAIVFAIATDFVTNIPVLIKGAELLYINSLKVPVTKSVAFKTGTSAFQIVEIWVTTCWKKLFAFQMGMIFLLLGIWSIAVGFVTEFIAWKFVLERRRAAEEPEAKRVFHSNTKRHRLHSENRAAKRKENPPRMDRIGSESAATITSSASLDSFQDSEDITTVSISSTEAHDDLDLPVNSDGERGAIVFFFLGIFLSALLLLPFLALILLRFKVFKKTEKREYFFKIGIVTGSVNLTFVYIFSKGIHDVPLWISVLILDFLVTLALQRRTAKFWHFILRKLAIVSRIGSIRPTGQPAEEREPGQLKFFFFGFGLGLLLSLFSMIYLLCFPGIQGKKTRKRFFKYGCILGALNNVIILELLIRSILIPHSSTLTGPTIFAFNAALFLFLIITERISP